MIAPARPTSWRAAQGLRARRRPALLDEVTGLVEWPVPLLGAIDAAFLALPPEVLVTTMRTQPEIPGAAHDGRRAGAALRRRRQHRGQRRRARDRRRQRARAARPPVGRRFFWDQDRKAPLESRLPALERIVFHAELGTLGATRRAAGGAGRCARAATCPSADRALAERAALLAKADLVTGMVGEFPELQGIMGGYYARAQGEPAAVADAIREHYAPKGPDDRCPTRARTASPWRWPTSSTRWSASSPSARSRPARRTRSRCAAPALGIIRLILENRPAPAAATGAFAAGARRLRRAAAERRRRCGAPRSCSAFFADRLKVQLRDRGVRHDLIDAVVRGRRRGRSGPPARPGRGAARVPRHRGRRQPAGRLPPRQQHRRASRRRRTAGATTAQPGRRARWSSRPRSRRCYAALGDAPGGDRSRRLGARGLSRGAMAALAALRAPVDAFFDAVTVNVGGTGAAREPSAACSARSAPAWARSPISR